MAARRAAFTSKTAAHEGQAVSYRPSGDLTCLKNASSALASSYGGHRGEQTPRTLILGDRRITVAEVLDAWLAPDYRYFKLKGADGHTYLVRHDERSNTWELTMFRAERVDGP